VAADSASSRRRRRCPSCSTPTASRARRRAGAPRGRDEPAVLTPHGGELARLLGTESAEVNARRLHHAREAARAAGSIVVLKGDDTLVAEPDGRVGVSPGGAPALATAGTGDVLSGVLGAMLAKGVEPFTAACAAVLLHVRAGRLAAEREGGPGGVIATDVIDALAGCLGSAGLTSLHRR